MDVRKVLAVVAVAAVVALPSEAHRGPEQHPTVQELEETTSELSGAIGDVEQRLRERIDGLEASVHAPDEQAIADTVERAVGEAAAELVQSSDELEDRVDAFAVIGAALLVGLACVSAFLGFRLRAVRKLLSSSSQDAGETERARAAPTDAERKAEEDEGRSDGRRVVTHTLKERIGSGMQPTTRELHSPGAAWSPRTREEAVADIRDRGIRYWARGPMGKEVEIEVQKKLNTWYLRTKPDEHGGNNLSELPDPP